MQNTLCYCIIYLSSTDFKVKYLKCANTVSKNNAQSDRFAKIQTNFKRIESSRAKANKSVSWKATESAEIPILEFNHRFAQKGQP